MVLPREIREQAFAMYCASIPLTQIAKLLNIKSESCVRRWKNIYNWEDRRDQLLKHKTEFGDLNETDQEKKLLDSILTMYIEAVKTDRDGMLKKMDYNAVLKAIQMRRLLRGESTENLNVSGEVWSVKEEFNKILEDGDE